MATFSISIPVLGQERFVEHALKSIKVQKAAYQVAVMDATPDDSVQRVLGRYADIFHYRRHGPDRGQAAAIQEGWENTSGDILAWLCADDYYLPDTLASVERVFQEYPEVDVVYGDSIFVDINNDFKMYFPSINSDISTLLYNDCIAQPSCFVRRSAIESIGKLNTNLHYIMDWDLWTRLYRNDAKFYYLKKSLSVTSVYQGTKTASMSVSRYLEINNHLKENASLLRRARCLLGGIYFDLQENHRSSVKNIIYILLKGIRGVVRLKNILFHYQNKSLYGLEIWTNRISEECELFFPWYYDHSPERLRIMTDRPLVLYIEINNIFSGKVEPIIKKEGYEYNIGVDKISGQLFHIIIRNLSFPNKCRLLSASIN